MSPLKIRTTAHLWLSTLFIILFLCLDFGALSVQNRIPAASPLTSREQLRGTAPRGSSHLQRDVELVKTSAQGVTIQLLIPKSDFHFGSSSTENRIDKVESQVISFPGCRFTAEPGDTAPPRADYARCCPRRCGFPIADCREGVSVRAVSKGLSIRQHRKEQRSQKKTISHQRVLLKLGEVAQIRENRILPIQFNPVQYNPVRREVRLYHRIVVEVRFIKTVTRGVSGTPSVMPSSLHTESAAYNAIFNDLLVNPQNAEQWRLPIARAPSAPSAPTVHPQYKISVTESGMYSITASELAAAGADVTAIMPRTLKLINRGNQIPIFVRGERDDKFDPTDEIIFLRRTPAWRK